LSLLSFARPGAARLICSKVSRQPEGSLSI
jgi:hypothetical protein